MTTPAVVPSKSKTWVGLVGSLLTFLVPALLDYSTSLPEPWPAVIAAVLAVLTALGVYRAPYKPAETVLVPEAAAPPQNLPTPPTSGGFRNPWL